MDISGNAANYQGKILYPAAFKIHFSFDIQGMKDQSFKCLKRICALAVSEYFHNTNLDQNLIICFTSSLIKESKGKTLINFNPNTFNSRYSNSFSRGYIVASKIFPPDLFNREHVTVEHFIPLLSTDGKLMTVKYCLSFKMMHYRQKDIERLLEIGYILLEMVGKNGLQGKKACERMLAVAEETQHWSHDDVLNRLKLEFTCMSPEKNNKKTLIKFSQDPAEKDPESGKAKTSNSSRLLKSILPK